MKPLKAIEVFMFSAQSDLDLQDINLFGQKPKRKKETKQNSVCVSQLCACTTVKKKEKEWRSSICCWVWDRRSMTRTSSAWSRSQSKGQISRRRIIGRVVWRNRNGIRRGCFRLISSITSSNSSVLHRRRRRRPKGSAIAHIELCWHHQQCYYTQRKT